VFNLQGSELVIILLLALVVLGPEKLPEAMRRMGRFYGDLKKMSTGFQQEFRSAVDEPLREFRQTADTVRDSVDFRKFQAGERDEKPTSAEMSPASPSAQGVADEPSEPTDDLPFGRPAPSSPPLVAEPLVAEPLVAEPLEAVVDESGLREARPSGPGDTSGASPS
jgi:sec-independent protein translocase protein TatB